MYVVVGAQHAAPLLGTLANSAAYSRAHLGRRKSNQVNSSYLQPKTDNFSVRPLSLIHVHVLRVDHIARLLLLRAARAGGRTPARSGARRRTGLSCRLRRLVQLFGDLVPRALD